MKDPLIEGRSHGYQPFPIGGGARSRLADDRRRAGRHRRRRRTSRRRSGRGDKGATSPKAPGGHGSNRSGLRARPGCAARRGRAPASGGGKHSTERASIDALISRKGGMLPLVQNE